VLGAVSSFSIAPW